MGILFVCVAMGKFGADMISLGRWFWMFWIVECRHDWKCAKLSLIYLHEVQICQVHWRENVGATFPAHRWQWTVLRTKLTLFFSTIGWECSTNLAVVPLGKTKAATKVSGSLFHTFGSRADAFVISRNFVAFYLHEDSKAPTHCWVASCRPNAAHGTSRKITRAFTLLDEGEIGEWKSWLRSHMLPQPSNASGITPYGIITLISFIEKSMVHSRPCGISFSPASCSLMAK